MSTHLLAYDWEQAARAAEALLEDVRLMRDTRPPKRENN
jgi:hypothetical protein